ncbi:hypothetical protein [Streptomyces sp. KL116D]|uniref:hypothetical protein n=1 Tax=Streptomyces sp. KL116D TaxID=3045152 RepID=UPI003558A0D3
MEEPVENGDHVDRWRTVFDDTYQASNPSAEVVDLAGWNDSTTGEPISEEGCASGSTRPWTASPR